MRDDESMRPRVFVARGFGLAAAVGVVLSAGLAGCSSADNDPDRADDEGPTTTAVVVDPADSAGRCGRRAGLGPDGGDVRVAGDHSRGRGAGSRQRRGRVPGVEPVRRFVPGRLGRGLVRLRRRRGCGGPRGDRRADGHRRLRRPHRQLARRSWRTRPTRWRTTISVRSPGGPTGHSPPSNRRVPTQRRSTRSSPRGRPRSRDATRPSPRSSSNCPTPSRRSSTRPHPSSRHSSCRSRPTPASSSPSTCR